MQSLSAVECKLVSGGFRAEYLPLGIHSVRQV
jgi:hypothetical protein